MKAIVDFTILIFSNIVKVLSIKPFEDFDVSYLQLILSSVVIVYILKFIFGNFNEINKFTDGTLGEVGSQVSKKMKNNERIQQLVSKKEYQPKHVYQSKHERK